MARSARIEAPGVVQHVMTHSPSGRFLYARNRDRSLYLDLLGAVVVERDWQLLDWCVMGTHVHLLLRTSRPDLGAGLKQVHEEFARYVNRTREERGHVFGQRYKNKFVLTESYFAAVVRYIARNPVEAGLCLEPEDWPWSATLALRGAVPAPAMLAGEITLGMLGVDRTGYAELVGKSNARVMAELAVQGQGDLWMISARDEHRIPVPEIAKFAAISVRTAYRRLADARDGNRGTVPQLPLR